jgi:hypothetical protein
MVVAVVMVAGVFARPDWQPGVPVRAVVVVLM